MSRADIAQRRANALIRRVGKQMAIRHPSTTGGPSPVINPPTIESSLLVNGNQSLSSSTLSLKATRLIGGIVSGDQFTIGSHTYTATGSVTAASNALVSIPITPNLAANITDGASVTPTWGADTAVYGVIGMYSALAIDGTLIQQKDLRITIPANVMSYVPTIMDKIVIDGFVKSIVNITPSYTQGSPASYIIQAR